VGLKRRVVKYTSPFVVKIKLFSLCDRIDFISDAVKFEIETSEYGSGKFFLKKKFFNFKFFNFLKFF
jgi:hypothetical protein